MKPEEVLKMLETVTAYAESLGGLRKQLIAQGFSPEVAEQLILNAIAPRRD